MKGTPIQEMGLGSSAVNVGITYSPIFSEFEACVAAGLDLERWVNGEYERAFRAHVIAWHEGKHLIEAHTKAAVHKAEEAQMRKARKK